MLSSFRRQIRRSVFNVIPRYNLPLYEFCARYVDRFNGDNNSNPQVNGEYSFLRRYLSGLRSGIVFDVGANVGDWASVALRINRDISLHCFEPSKATYHALAGKEWPQTVRLNNLALGEVEGVLQLNVVGDESALNSVYDRRGIDVPTAVKKEPIVVTTVDRYCEENGIRQIDLIKVDVEGHELAVFKGMTRMLSEGFVRRIQFEYGGCNIDARVTLRDIWEFLEVNGFALYKLFPEGPRRPPKYQQSLETFKYSNWLAIPEALSASSGPVPTGARHGLGLQPGDNE